MDVGDDDVDVACESGLDAVACPLLCFDTDAGAPVEKLPITSFFSA